MAKKMTKQEYAAWRSRYAGKSQFEIFHKEDGAAVVDFTFWAASRNAAVDELEMFKQKQQLISPTAETEYFYREINTYIVANEDGTYTLGSRLTDAMGLDEEESPWERIKGVFSTIALKMRDVKYMLYDVMFWLGHYNMKTNSSEERADWWNLDGTILRKLLFNIPRLIKSLRGCPSKYVAEAVVKSRSGDGHTLTMDQAYLVQANDKEMDMAMSAWKADLEKLLLYIRLYEYYGASGNVEKEDGPEMAEIDKKYRSTLPLLPGTDGEIDHLKCEELTQKYWEMYCDHWKAIGRVCWS